MLFFRLALILLVAGIRIVVAADGQPEFAPPDTLISRRDSNPTLQPYVGSPLRGGDSVGGGSKLIRGLLIRQSCPGGWGLCNDGV